MKTSTFSQRKTHKLKPTLQKEKNRTSRYIDRLDDMVQTYNKTPHKSLDNIAPQSVNKGNEANLWAHMFLKPSKVKGVRPYQFKLKDMVRISHTNMIFKRSYDEQYTREIFKITKRFRMQNIPMYRLKDLLSQPIKGNFYESELQKVDKNEDTLWFIEKRLRKRKRNGQVEWLVKFYGFDHRFNQWIPERDITDVSEENEQT